MRAITLLAVVAVGFASGQASGPVAGATRRVFPFAHAPTEKSAKEIESTVRVLTGLTDTSVDFSARTLTVEGTADQIALAEWLLIGLDRTVPIPPDAAVHEYRLPDGSNNPGGTDSVVRLFYLERGETVQELQEFATMLRTIAEIRRMSTYNSGKVLALRGTVDVDGGLVH